MGEKKLAHPVFFAAWNFGLPLPRFLSLSDLIRVHWREPKPQRSPTTLSGRLMPLFHGRFSHAIGDSASGHEPNMNKKIAWIGCVFALILAGYGTRTLLLPASADTTTAPPSINGNCNAVGNNNSNCGTYDNYEPKKFQLTDQIKTQLLKSIPIDKPGIVEIIGSTQPDLNLGMQIFRFLQISGYNVGDESITIGMSSDMPEKPLTLLNPPTRPKWILTIAPSVR